MEDLEKINELRNEGHSHHCACRQVWGDGECECDLYSYGYDPYAWMKGTFSKFRKNLEKIPIVLPKKED